MGWTRHAPEEKFGLCTASRVYLVSIVSAITWLLQERAKASAVYFLKRA